MSDVKNYCKNCQQKVEKILLIANRNYCKNCFDKNFIKISNECKTGDLTVILSQISPFEIVLVKNKTPEFT